MGHAIHIVHRGETVAVGGNVFLCISRLDLLRILQHHCRRIGVTMRFDTRAEDARDFADCDLLVGADGANSVIREHFEGRFETELEIRPNKFVWYGTEQGFNPISLIFREHAGGLFIAHAYSYSKAMSTFIVECDAASWEDAGVGKMSDAQSRAFCEEIFRGELAGRPLLSNKSVWMNYTVVRNRRWRPRQCGIVGRRPADGAFLCGIGNANGDGRMRLRCTRRSNPGGNDVVAALGAFEAARKPVSDAFQDLAHNSIVWYETVKDRADLDPVTFAYSYMRRTGKVSPRRFAPPRPGLDRGLRGGARLI